MAWVEITIDLFLHRTSVVHFTVVLVHIFLPILLCSGPQAIMQAAGDWKCCLFSQNNTNFPLPSFVTFVALSVLKSRTRGKDIKGGIVETRASSETLSDLNKSSVHHDCQTLNKSSFSAFLDLFWALSQN